MLKTVSIASLIFLSASAANAVSPSRVLVLYNADWTDDHFLTDPGQDSKEIAEHYISMHTDLETGEKPYTLGLSCVHAAKHLGKSHLNSNHLVEQSSDNATGVIFKSSNPLKSNTNGDIRDSRALEFTLPKVENASWKFETLRISLAKNRSESVLLVEGGKSMRDDRVAVQKEGAWNARTNARTFLTGSFTAEASCQDTFGESHKWRAEYTDFADVHFTKTGPDNDRDDQNYLQDIENQVKKFLEDSANARPDGTLLKDHILFIVVCYGLPRTTVAPYGIARGITDIIANHGAIISLEQRLQLIYYDVDKVMRTTPQPQKFKSSSPFTAYYFRTPQAKPLNGISANPFMHPLLYNKDKGDLDNLPEPLSFSSETRNRIENKHLFFVMRIDATTPMEARGLMDRAVYASKYGGPSMGQIADESPTKTEDQVGKLSNSPAGNWLWEKGFHNLYYSPIISNRLRFMRLNPEQLFFNQEPVFLPGGIAGTVISHNGWNKGDMVRDLAMGTTVTAGVAQVYGGAPHIHDKSWWDDEILYPFLVKGRTMGEILLMNQTHLGWITTFIGDPLYSLPKDITKDDKPPEFNNQTDVHFITPKDMTGDRELWLRVDLQNSPGFPETAQLIAISEEGITAVCETFEARPYLKLTSLEDAFTGTWRLELIDPFGHISKADCRFDSVH